MAMPNEYGMGRGEGILFTVILVSLFLFVSLAIYVDSKTPTPDQMCQEQFGQDYYHSQQGLSGGLCTNHNGDVRYLR